MMANRGTQDIAVSAALILVAVLGDERHHGVCGTFRTGGGDRNDAANGECLGDGALLAAVEIPEIAIILHAQCNALGRVHNGAAAEGQDEINALALGQLDALVNQIGVGAGFDAAQLYIGDVLCVQRSLDAIQQAAALDTAAAVMDQNLMTAVTLYILTGLIFGTLAKDEIGGAIKSKIIHSDLLKIICPDGE